MPKRVDHEERRREITEALFRIAATQGLQAVTLRAVAAEAGISMNLVQYYFATKEEMLRYAWQRVTELSGERAGKIIAEALKTGDERAILRACLLCVLPADERSRMVCAVQIAYFAVDVTRGSQTQDQQAMFPNLVRVLGEQIQQAQAHSRIPAHLNPRLEAGTLATMASGLMNGMMVDVHNLEQATELVDYRLGQLFTDR
ncbi:TetR/AcrR family transcriptional regulator [Kibdelosporangium phytohabitans]|uniref:Transcriptional regulator n=1 Tax=Kibdelosporangium phytohabitans TaxID=860235 RepID=A0A0N9IIJ3_9PSEU|nr:TetR/AcrR family transcriptional regulator [Kibdelosporangium phytohabitans]ALG14848.1 transcriptional regulator [Kibdelosporangium phytohabitans]MBE1470521.1 AcrR family transcriptional regulator [Kibdelosporangium phytohabitans]